MKRRFNLLALAIIMSSTPMNASKVDVDVEAESGGGKDLEDSFELNLNDVHFLLWTRSNPGDVDYYELLIDDETNLAASPFSVSRPTLVLAHGWMSDGRLGWPVEAKTELLQHSDCNVISIDWSRIADDIDYYLVVANLPKVAQRAADFLDYLHSAAHLNLTSLYLIGHSLGAHLVGFIGSDVINGPIGRITGLDPAGPGFNSTTDRRLSSSDATFVDVIHTNAGVLPEGCVGLDANLGHVDYYPNGGKHQPGCVIEGELSKGDGMVLLSGGCSHGRSHEYWIESIKGDPPFTSGPCPDRKTYQAGGCRGCGKGCLNMGFHAFTELRGTYFLKTNAMNPYARGNLYAKGRPYAQECPYGQGRPFAELHRYALQCPYFQERPYAQRCPFTEGHPCA